MLRAQGLGGLRRLQVLRGVSPALAWWAGTTVRTWRNQCRFLTASFGVRTNISPSFYVYRVCTATGPTFTNSLLRRQEKPSDSSLGGQNLWKMEKGDRESSEWERHKMKRWREKVNKGNRKGRREEEIWARVRSSLSLSAPPHPPGHKETKRTPQEGTLALPVSWWASFSSYSHLCSTHIRCSVNVCWVERSTDWPPESQGDLFWETPSMYCEVLWSKHFSCGPFKP